MSEKKKGSDLVLISLKLPRSMLEEVDKVVAEKGYLGRSDFIRHAVRAYLSKVRRE